MQEEVQGGETSVDNQLPEPQENENQPEAQKGEEQKAENKNANSSENQALFVAVEALEGLTDAVEALANMSEQEAKDKLVELASEFRELAERLSPSKQPKPGADAKGKKPTPHPCRPVQAQGCC